MSPRSRRPTRTCSRCANTSRAHRIRRRDSRRRYRRPGRAVARRGPVCRPRLLTGMSGARTDLARLNSPDAKRNPGDEVAAETVLEAIQDFLAAVADDLVEPHAAVHGHEERSLVQPGRPRVGGEVRIDEVVPDADD